MQKRIILIHHKHMTQPKMSAARREIIHAYDVLKQVHGDNTTVRHVCEFLGRPLDSNGNHSHIRRVIKEYEASLQIEE